MPIPNPSLDDLTFEQLVEEAKKNIPLFTKAWTNFNLSDPGITILELFAWLTENQIYTLNKITKRNYVKFLNLLGVRPFESNPSKIDLKIFANRTKSNDDDDDDDDDNRSSFFLPKHTPFIARQEEIFVETEEGIFIIPSLQINRCIVYSNNHYSEVKLARPVTVDDSLFSFVSPNLSSNSMTKSGHAMDNNSMDNDPHSPVNSAPFFFLFGEDPKDGDCFYLKIEFNPRHIKKDSEVSLSFYLYEKDCPPVGRHGYERPEDFIEKDFQSKLLWEYARAEERNSIEDATGIRNIVWSPLNVEEDNTGSFSKSGKITFQYPTNRTRETFVLFSDLSIEREKEKEKENGKRYVSNKGELWIRCKIVKQNFHFIAPRIEFILTNTVSCSIGYTVKSILKNKSTPLYKPKSTYLFSQDIADPNESHYQEMSNGLSNQIFEIKMDLKFQIFKFNYLEISKGNWDKESWQWKWKEWKEWDKVDDLISSRPYDKHYVIIDIQKGLVKFGDGENGKVPPKESKIRAEYKFGNAQHLLIEQGKRFTIDELQMKKNYSNIRRPPFYDRIVAINPFHSSIGRRAETIREAIIRARQELIIPFKAVSRSDYEYLTKNTPGLRVGKVRAVASEHSGEENMLVIAAVPYPLSPFARRLDSTRDFRDAIRRHLEKHKLITTRIQVIEPKYIGISINTRIKLAMKRFEQNNMIKRRIAGMLDSYFSLFRLKQTPKEEDDGWDFGRNVYRSKLIAIIQSIAEIETVLELRLQGYGDSGGFHTDAEGNILMEELNLVYLKDLFISFI